LLDFTTQIYVVEVHVDLEEDLKNYNRNYQERFRD